MPRRTGQHQAAAKDLAYEKGLPANPDAERFCLGSVLLNDSVYDQVAEALELDDWSLEKHRRIFGRMKDLHDRGERIDRVTMANELARQGQLESVDGLGYLVSLDDGLPEIANIGSYIRIVKEKAALRKIIFHSQRTINNALQGEFTSDELAAEQLSFADKVRSGAERSEDGRTPESIVLEFPGGISAFLDPTLRKRGLPTGFRRLDDMLGGGLQNGEMIILAARPTVGKSACCLNICQHVVMHPRTPQRADIFSLEMSGESLITRMLCAAARVDQHKFRAGFLNKDERGALQNALYRITTAPLRIHDDFKKTLPALVRRIRHAHKEGSKLIAIDYVQLMVTGSRAENRNLEIGEIGRTLKLIALELQIPVLLLSQIARSAERRGGDQRPQLSDLKDSGTLEEHADTVLSLYREELVKRDRDDNRGLADLDILKQRNGPTGRVPLRFIGQWTSFENRAQDADFPEEPGEPPPTPSFHDRDGW
jgi:replicative DNA helicase